MCIRDRSTWGEPEETSREIEDEIRKNTPQLSVMNIYKHIQRAHHRRATSGQIIPDSCSQIATPRALPTESFLALQCDLSSARHGNNGKLTHRRMNSQNLTKNQSSILKDVSGLSRQATPLVSDKVKHSAPNSVSKMRREPVLMEINLVSQAPDQSSIIKLSVPNTSKKGTIVLPQQPTSKAILNQSALKSLYSKVSKYVSPGNSHTKHAQNPGSNPMQPNQFNFRRYFEKWSLIFTKHTFIWINCSFSYME
eukprot:TRINITY_DN4015_c0_g1_i4.p1 TRINITY_DN4015_c0_g1~~TRINITY_DN4015_c0_g1_i4.p1  ORF type:complete len:252 (-),score=26.56 TRINITY_DN4015_c0_g1_i4:136-891(-)